MDPARRFLSACSDPRVQLEVERFGCTTVSRDWALHRRRVPEHYLVAILRGAALAAGSDGRQRRLERHSLLWIGPGRPHDLIPQRHPFRMYHLRFRLLADGRALALPGPDRLLATADDLQRSVAELFLEWQAAQAWRELCFRGRLTALCGALLRRGELGDGDGPRRLDEAQRARLFAYLDRHLPGPLQAAGLIAALGLSHDYGTRLFRATFGLPPRTWLVHERIRRAADELTHSSASIASIAERWCFSGPHVFSRQFRQVLGTTPSRWRAQRDW